MGSKLILGRLGARWDANHTTHNLAVSCQFTYQHVCDVRQLDNQEETLTCSKPSLGSDSGTSSCEEPKLPTAPSLTQLLTLLSRSKVSYWCSEMNYCLESL